MSKKNITWILPYINFIIMLNHQRINNWSNHLRHSQTCWKITCDFNYANGVLRCEKTTLAACSRGRLPEASIASPADNPHRELLYKLFDGSSNWLLQLLRTLSRVWPRGGENALISTSETQLFDDSVKEHAGRRGTTHSHSSLSPLQMISSW